MKDAICPTCREDVALHSFSNEEKTLKINTCEQCHGIFLSHSTLQKLVIRAQKREIQHLKLSPEINNDARPTVSTQKSDSKTTSPKKHCPHCKRPMLHRPFSDEALVIIDVCQSHGIWFDQKELSKIIDSLRANAKLAAKASIHLEGTPRKKASDTESQVLNEVATFLNRLVRKIF